MKKRNCSDPKSTAELFVVWRAEKYLKQHNISLQQDLSAVKNGHDEALFRLISFDRWYLYYPDSENLIKKRDVERNNDFFKKLSKALTSTNTKKRASKYANIVLLLKKHPEWHNPSSVRKFCDAVVAVFAEIGDDFDEVKKKYPDLANLLELCSDPDLYSRFLKNNGFRKLKKKSVPI